MSDPTNFLKSDITDQKIFLLINKLLDKQSKILSAAGLLEADKDVTSLFNSIEKSKNINLDKFIFALGIRYIGEINSEILELFIDARIY